MMMMIIIIIIIMMMMMIIIIIMMMPSSSPNSPPEKKWLETSSLFACKRLFKRNFSASGRDVELPHSLSARWNKWYSQLQKQARGFFIYTLED